MEDRVFDSHEQFNKYQSIMGNRPSEMGTKPSSYITAVKLRKAFKTLRRDEIEDVFEKEMLYNTEVDRAREKLTNKIETLLEWQLNYALGMLYDLGNLKAAQYVLKSKLGDLEMEYQPKEN